MGKRMLGNRGRQIDGLAWESSFSQPPHHHLLLPPPSLPKGSPRPVSLPDKQKTVPVGSRPCPDRGR